MSSMRQHGGAVEVTLTAAVEKNSPVYADGFHGVAQQDGSSGDTIAIEIEQRVHELNVGDITADLGDLIYITDAGVLDDSASGNAVFGKVVSAKDENDIAWVLLLPQQVSL